ncbi:MAG: aldehyde dehydrogenase family protein [Chloroflexi bacterium]|nr:aldehyde dehydrogenase family protein [Chloroflexota bacterium]
MPKKNLIGGEWRGSDDVMEVRFPYDGSLVDAVSMASAADMNDAMEAALEGFELTRRLPSHRRSEILANMGRLLGERFDEVVEAMIMEGGKNRKTAVGETARAMETLKVSSEEARRIGGEVFSIDWTAAGENRQGFTRRAPIGTVLGITPFNYPVNLACHKIGPAIAVGNPIILKPAEKTPLSSVILAEIVLEAGYPPRAFSMLNAWGPDSEMMAADPRVAMISFTGGGSVGWMLKSKAGQKKVTLELGGNAGVIVHNDADLADAAGQAAAGGYANAGQNCISVQRLLIQRDVFEEFTDLFVDEVRALKVGDPRDGDVDVGPMISVRDAERAEDWVKEAKKAGASVLHGEARQGAMFPPTVLTETAPDMRVNCEEVFAPVVTVSPYEAWDEAVATINDSPYGLQAGVFTQDVKRIMDAWERVDVGGLHVNSVSTFRVDHMPYGGIKASGSGREGIKYAIEDMTELRLMTLNLG